MNYSRVYRNLEGIRDAVSLKLNPPDLIPYNKSPIFELIGKDLSSHTPEELFLDGIHLPHPITRFYESDFGGLYGCIWELKESEFGFVVSAPSVPVISGIVSNDVPRPLVKFLNKDHYSTTDAIAVILGNIMASFVIREIGPVVVRSKDKYIPAKWYKKAQWITVVNLRTKKGDSTKKILTGVVRKSNEQQLRAAHWRAGHKRRYNSDRFKKRETWVKGHYVGPDEFQHNGQVYKVVR